MCQNDILIDSETFLTLSFSGGGGAPDGPRWPSHYSIYFFFQARHFNHFQVEDVDEPQVAEEKFLEEESEEEDTKVRNTTLSLV